MIPFEFRNVFDPRVLLIQKNLHDSWPLNRRNSFYMKVQQRDKIVNHFKFRRLWPTFESGWQHQSCITEPPSSRHQF